MASEDASVAEHLECAICFDRIGCRTELPCACKIDYCDRCWDRSLAQSFNSCGWSRCPSCRTQVRIDYDADAGRLLFSREQVEERPLPEVAEHFRGSEPGVPRVMSPERRERKRARLRLIEQARPAQIRILKEFGLANNPAFYAQCDDLERFAEVACLERPRCVCGGQLEHVSYRERVGRVCLRQMSRCPAVGSVEFEQLLDCILATRDADKSCCSCDLCGRSIQVACWTCANGSNTILHASAYDVCADCFALHCFGVSLESAPPIIPELSAELDGRESVLESIPGPAVVTTQGSGLDSGARSSDEGSDEGRRSFV